MEQQLFVDFTAFDIAMPRGIYLAFDAETRLILETMVAPEPLDEAALEAWLDDVADRHGKESSP